MSSSASEHRPVRRWPLGPSTLVLVAVVGCSWIAFIVWGHRAHLDHETALTTWRDVATFIAGWTVMVMAMMLPSTTALFETVAGIARRRPDGPAIHLLVAVGFAAVWLGVGLAFRLGDIVVHAAVDAAGGWVDDRHVAGALLIGAGGFQFTSLKYRCLTRCRSPRGLVIRSWSGRQPAADAIRIGSTYGWSCVGCCWALMLLLFGLGIANPAWMFALGALMAIEKNVPGSAPLSRGAGIAMIGVGVVLLVTG